MLVMRERWKVQAMRGTVTGASPLCQPVEGFRVMGHGPADGPVPAAMAGEDEPVLMPIGVVVASGPPCRVRVTGPVASAVPIEDSEPCPGAASPAR